MADKHSDYRFHYIHQLNSDKSLTLLRNHYQLNVKLHVTVMLCELSLYSLNQQHVLQWSLSKVVIIQLLIEVVMCGPRCTCVHSMYTPQQRRHGVLPRVLWYSTERCMKNAEDEVIIHSYCKGMPQ